MVFPDATICAVGLNQHIRDDRGLAEVCNHRSAGECPIELAGGGVTLQQKIAGERAGGRRACGTQAADDDLALGLDG